MVTHSRDLLTESPAPARAGVEKPRVEKAAAGPSRVQLMLQLQAAGGNQAVGRLLAPEPQQSYPFADRINAALRHPAPLRSVVDPAGCAEAGAAAFTDGGVTHFATATPDLHVAAHEAAHLMQHAGRTRDAGLGAEAHAGAVADAVVAGRPAVGLVGPAGAAVPAGRHNYTPADGDGKWKGVSPGAVFTKLADTGETFIRGPHLAYATAPLITGAAAVLAGQKSGVTLSVAAGDQKTVDAPDGSGQKSLSRLQVDIAAGGEKQTMPADCRRAALEVMGLSQNPAASVQYEGQQSLVKPKDPRDTIAETLFIQKRIRETPDYAKLSGPEQREVIEKAKADFAELPREEKDRLKHSPLADEAAAKLGLDTAAQPGVGEAFSIHRAGAAPEGQFEYHYAAVILVTGEDRITLENSGGEKGQRDQSWKMEMYGPASKRQSFHDEWARSFGADAHTVVDRDPSLRAPAGAADYPTMKTYDLLTRYRDAKTPDEVGALEQELRKRQIQVDVTVDELEDSLGDEVFVKLRSGGRTRESGIVSFGKGTSKAFELIPLDDLWPVTDKLTVDVLEWDVIGNDLIGTVNWPVPLFDKVDVPLSYKSARYRVSLAMAGRR